MSSPRTSISSTFVPFIGFVVAVDALLRVVGAGQTDEADALAACSAIAFFISSPAAVPSSVFDEPT